MRHFLPSLILAVACLVLPLAAQGGAANANADGSILFGDLHFGLSRADALKLPNAKAGGEGAFATSVTLPATEYAGHTWDVRLDFVEDMLSRVSLMAAHEPQRVVDVNNALSDAGFEMLAILADKSRLDFIVTLKNEGAKALQDKIAAIYNAERVPRRLSYAWFDTSKISRQTKQGVRNLSQFTQVIAADTREVEVTLMGDGATMTHMLVDFTLPVMEMQALSKQK